MSQLLYKGKTLNSLLVLADDVPYDNAESGLEATNVKDALDEVSDDVSSGPRVLNIDGSIDVGLKGTLLTSNGNGTYTWSEDGSPVIGTIEVEADDEYVNGKIITATRDEGGEIVIEAIANKKAILKVNFVGNYTVSCSPFLNQTLNIESGSYHHIDLHVAKSALTLKTTSEDLFGQDYILSLSGVTIATGTFDDSGMGGVVNVYEAGEYVLKCGENEVSQVVELENDYEMEVNSLKIVTFADGTDEEIANMLEAHYAGDIDISDYWSVGDKRKIHLNAMAATGVSERHHADDYEFVIIGMNHDDMTAGGKAALTLQTDRILYKNTTDDWYTSSYPSSSDEGGYMNSTNSNSYGWESCARRTWCNNVFFASLPTWIQALIKPVNKLTSAGSQVSTIKTTSDNVFLLSEIEVLGTTSRSYVGEGTQYDYFKIGATTVSKKPGVSGGPGGALWWGRSPDTNTIEGYFVVWYAGNSISNASQSLGIAPAFCL